MRRRGFVSSMYRAARFANDVTVLASGNPHRIARRAKNKIVGRALARSAFWRLRWGR
jgi:hypothetical protein